MKRGRSGELRIDPEKEGSIMRMVSVMATLLVMLTGCTQKEAPMDTDKLREFATNYTSAWCSQDPARVASFFAENGSLKINKGSPLIGRKAITAGAQGFMTTFPDLVLTMDGITVADDHVVYRWTLNGTNTGPGGTGNAVRISGYEEWTLGADGLIAESKGHFDEADYQRQLEAGNK